MNKTISLLIGIFSLSLVSAQQYPYGGCWGMMSGTYGYGFMAFAWIFWILVLVALILLIIWLIRQLQQPARRRR
ncbi:MAG: hypothetical protein QXI33_02910 [Candidatus Pacearchaeota archaeon]